MSNHFIQSSVLNLVSKSTEKMHTPLKNIIVFASRGYNNPKHSKININ